MSTVARQHPPPAFREGLEQREPGPLDISKRRKMIGVSHGGGTPVHHPFIDGFSLINHPVWSITHFGKPPNAFFPLEWP